jgi:hypothetical protein
MLDKTPQSLKMKSAILFSKLLYVLYVVLLSQGQANAKGLAFAMVGKSIIGRNFIAAAQGCNKEAQRFGEEWILIGGAINSDRKITERRLCLFVKRSSATSES